VAVIALARRLREQVHGVLAVVPHIHVHHSRWRFTYGLTHPQPIYCTLPSPIGVTARELAVELFPLVVSDIDKGIYRLIDEHEVKME
jgi:hypothetical protein